MTAILEKVTVFIVRSRPDRTGDLLLLRHPYAGIQLPAGTVEPGEAPEAAAAREAWEETGLAGLQLAAHLGSEEDPPPPNSAVVVTPTSVYARPDLDSFDWARLPRGIVVEMLRQAPGFVQVAYTEWDRWPDPQYVSYAITGWAPAVAITTQRRRHFYRFNCLDETPDTWTVATDHHQFTLFWAPLDNLPPLVHPQAPWLRWLTL